MKKFGLLVAMLILISTSLFSVEYYVGDKLSFYPTGTPRAANKNGDGTSSYVTKVSKAIGYPDGYFELQITSADWVGSSIFPILFTYIVKENDVLEFCQTKNIYVGSVSIKILVKKVSSNSIELEEIADIYGEIVPSEDSL